ncbi:MAG: bifunctional DNA primase/polymerase [Planctomycetota bacterium]
MIDVHRPNTDLARFVEYGYGLGWSFTPLAGKAPVLKGWQKRPRESLGEALRWAGEGNVGLRTGRVSGVVVVDIDPGADTSELELPATVTVRTGREGGRHLYYACREPVGCSNGRKLGPHIDFKGDGGQVVFPGSVHPETGQVYRWEAGRAPWEIELAELPASILARLREAPPRQAPVGSQSAPNRATPPPPHRRPSPRENSAGEPAATVTARDPQRYAQQVLRRELEHVRSAANGQRNETLNRAAFNLGTLVASGHLERAEVEATLHGAAESTALPPAEIAATVRSGLDAGLRHPRRIEPRAPQTEAAAPPVTRAPACPADRRPGYILLPGPHRTDADEYIERSAAAFAGEVLDALPADALYRRDFIPGEVLGQAGRRRWIETGADRMRLLIDGQVKLGKWVRSRKTKEPVLLYQSCSKDAAGVVLAHARQAPRVRELELMVAYPVYGPGFVRVEPGWRDGLFYDEPPELAGLRPERDCEVIQDVLHDLVVDFPFKGEADRQNFFGLLLTPIIAPALEGSRPMHLINSPLERTGKTKLVDEVFAGVLIGRQCPAMQMTDREEEREKRILAMLLQGETLMHLDNLPGYLDSASLASLLTAHVFGGRMLGLSRMVKLANHLSLVGTGNNVAASGEIAKRIVPILIEPTSARPEARSDFQHPDLRGYVRSRRKQVLACLLGMVQNWLDAGRPKHPNRLGGFESWSETVGGILQVNGLHEWRTNEGDWRQIANPEGVEMKAFVEAWHERYGLGETLPKELRELAEREELFDAIFAKRTPHAVNVAFGRMLRRYTDTPVSQWFIRRLSSGNASKFRLEAIQ